jgi:hypothetical protein
MAILQNRRTVFSLSNSEVMSNSAPSTEAGITKSEGHDGFFIYSDKAFTLWFKDQGGSWSSYNTYNLVDLDDGVAFSWGTNTAAFIQTSEVSHSIAVFIIETKQVGQFRNLENRNINEAGLNRLDVHSNYKRVRMQNSGHTGEAYAIAIFDENGDAAYVSAPPSGQREGKVLGWDENGNLGWTTLAAAQSFTAYNDAVIDGNTITLDGDGDYAIYDGEHRYTDQISISAWFKTTATGERTIYSSHVRSYSQFLNGFFGKVTNGTLRIRTPDGGGGESSHGSGLNDGEWHHMTVTWEASTTGGKKVYIDGALVSTTNTAAANGYAPDWDLYIGAIPWVGNNPYSFFDGQIANFNLTNSIITGQEVYNDYVNNNPTPGYTPPDPNSVPSPDLYFDGSSTDAQVGTNSFSLGGAVLSTSKGKYGSDSFDFGPTGNKNPMLLSSGINLSSGIYTFSLWFYNKRTVNNWGSVIRSTNASYPIITKYPNSDELGNYTGGTFAGTGFFMTQFEDLQEWTHLVIVANGSTSTYYVNGQQAGTPVNRVITSIANQFGSMSGGQIQTFAEALDEIAYWETALSAQQVALIYNSSEKLYTPPSAPSTPAELPSPDFYLDGSSTETQIGNNTIGLGGASLSTSNGKYDPNSFSFGASGNKAPIRIGTDLDLSTGVYTFSLWFYNVRSGTDWKSVFRRTSGASPVNTAQYPILVAPTTNELSLLTESLANGGAINSTGYDMSSFVGNNTWNHLAVVADGTNSTFYVNGQQAGNVVNEVITTSVGEIGAYDGNDTQVFAQGLDEIAYWGSALTADQVAEIYNSSVKLGGLVTEAPASQNLEESAGATYIADAVVTNGILDLDGTGDYVSIPHDVAYERETGDMSVMLWFKPRAIGYLSTLISKTTGNPSWEGWVIQVTEDDLSATDLNGNSMANGGFRFFNSQGSNDIKYLAPTGGISLDQWHHMTMVMKASGAYEFYYDGALLGSFTPSSKSTSNNTPLIIGANKDGGSQPAYNRMFNGMIDDVTIVKEALTSDQIAAAYNAGAPE